MDNNGSENKNESLRDFDIDEIKRLISYDNEAEAKKDIIITDLKKPEATPEEKPAPKPSAKAEKTDFAGEVYSWMQAIVTSLVVIILVFVFLVRIIGVKGDSMYPTLHAGDKIVLLNSLLYTEPKVGDVVVLRQLSFSTEPIVKRVIAVENQTVDIDFAAGIVYVDGVAQDDSYTNSLTTLAYDIQFPITVPEGAIFVLGDNRDDSIDSRYSQIGCIDTRCVMGKVLFAVYPFERIGKTP